MEKDPARKYKGRWRCGEIEKEELGAAIDQASTAGIYIDEAMTIYTYMPSFEEGNWHTFSLLKEANAALKKEVETLRAQLRVENSKDTP